ncbi:MAG: four helix bundle protein [Planctomycetota bacterium]
MKLARKVYQVSRNVPVHERFGLRMQMRRSAVSIPSNIAEGYARWSRADYLRHLRIAQGSLAELMTQLELALDLEMIAFDQHLNDLMFEEDRILQALVRGIQARIAEKTSNG